MRRTGAAAHDDDDKMMIEERQKRVKAGVEESVDLWCDVEKGKGKCACGEDGKEFAWKARQEGRVEPVGLMPRKAERQKSRPSVLNLDDRHAEVDCIISKPWGIGYDSYSWIYVM